MSDNQVLLEIADGIARITLNRPDKGNALGQAMADALLAIAGQVADDPAVRVVVLTGAGRMFCVGGDITEFLSGGDDPTVGMTRLAGTLHKALNRFAAMPKPLVTLVNGPAAGAGMSMAIAGDIALAAPGAYFTCAYGKIGLTPDGGMTWTLPRLVGMRRAQDLLVTSRRVPAPEAAEIGLITRTVAEGALEDEGMALARDLSNGAVAAMGQARGLLHEAFLSTFADQMDREVQNIVDAAGRPEGREGIAAFLAGRAPDFRGTPSG